MKVVSPGPGAGADTPKVVPRVPGGSVQSAAVYAVQLASGAPGGASGAFPDEKGSIFDHLRIIWLPKMAFLRSGTEPICFKFDSAALKMKEFQVSLD